jgi:hypothetical protein
MQEVKRAITSSKPVQICQACSECQAPRNFGLTPPATGSQGPPGALDYDLNHFPSTDAQPSLGQTTAKVSRDILNHTRSSRVLERAVFWSSRCRPLRISSLRMCSRYGNSLRGSPLQFFGNHTDLTSQRAHELIAVNQSQAALNVVHEHVTSKRTRNTPIASLEPVMLLFVELCVDLRKGKSAKDGLYQYKNIAQNSNVGTIEV